MSLSRPPPSPSTPTIEYHPHPPRLLSSLIPSLPNPANLLAAVPGAAHQTVFSPPLTDEGPASPGLWVGTRNGNGIGGGSGRMGSRRGSRDQGLRESLSGRGRGSLRRRGTSSRSIAQLAASLSDSPEMVDESLLPDERKRVLHDIRELFAGRPSVEIWERSFRSDCTYEDPLVRAVGVRQVAAQFHLLPLLLPPQTLASLLLASTPTQLVLSQHQLYTLRAIPSLRKTVRSVLVVELDPGDRVRAMWDLWGGEGVPVRWGAATLRRLNGVVTPWVVRVPKEIGVTTED